MENGWHNKDGSEKVAIEVGGGGAIASGGTRPYQNHGWTYRMGGGYHFNRRLAVVAEYSFNHFDVPQARVKALFPQPTLSPIVGAVHVWSLTTEPVYTFFSSERTGVYVVGGGGFYRKLTLFRETPTGCPPASGCDVTSLDLFHASNNAGGVDAGLGAAHRVSAYSNVKLFAEGRYVWIDNERSPHNVLYPPANQPTSFGTLTGGLRW